MLGSLFERRAIRDPQWDAWGRGDDLTGTAARAGVRVTEENSVQLLAVFTCVSTVSDVIATLPVDTYREQPDGTQVEVPTPAWLEQPNVDTDRVAFFGQSLVSILLRGNAYWLVIRNPLGAVVELWNLHPDMVQVQPDGMRRKFNVMGKPFSGEIVQVPGIMFPGAIKGIDPIMAARDAIGLGLATQIYGSTFFSQGAMPSGVIQAPGIVTNDQAKELAQQWRAAHGGLNKSNLPAVLTGGAQYQSISITPEQSQFLETRRYTDEQIYKLFGLTHPFSPMSGPNLTYANVEQLGTDVTRFTLMRWIVRLERAASRLLPGKQYARFCVDGFLRADLKTRYESYAIALDPKASFMTKNEVRAHENLEPIDGGDELPAPPAPAPAPVPVETVPANADNVPVPSANSDPRKVEVRVVLDEDNIPLGVEEVIG